MNLRRYLLSGVLTVATITQPALALAQSPLPLPTEAKNFLQTAGVKTDGPVNYSSGEMSSTLVPAVFATDLKATVGTGNAINGTFTITNEANRFVGDIGYDILLLGPEATAVAGQLVADRAPLYDKSHQSEVISLAPGASRQISFNYQALAVPAGQYRVRVQLTTSNDRQMGWATTAVTLQGASAFAVLRDQVVATTSVDVLTNKERTTWAALEGVNVDPGQAVTLQANANNVTTQEVKAIPEVSVRRILATGTGTATIKGTAVSIAPNASQPISLAVPAPSEPGAYQLMLTLRNAEGQQVGSLAEYRYVVRGVSASVISANFQELRRKQGEQAVVAFSIVGPADRQTDISGSVEVSVLNGSTVAGNTSQPVQLNASAKEGTARVKLDKNIEQPGIKVVIKDQAGTVLDTYVSALPDLPAVAVTPGQQSLKGLSLIGGLLLLLLVLFALWYRNRGDHKPTSGGTIIGGTTAGLLLIGVFVTGALPVSHASGIQFQHYWWSEFPATTMIFINQPLHNSTVPAGGLVPYQVRMSWSACANDYSIGRLTVEAPDAPQQVSFDSLNLEIPGWRPLAQFVQDGHLNDPTFNFFANLDLSSLPAGTKTTLRTFAVSQSTYKTGWNYGIVTDFTWITVGSTGGPTSSPSTSGTPQPSTSPTPTSTTGADIGVTIQAPSSVVKTSALAYTVTVQNNGPETASNVTLNQPIPTGLTFNANSSSGACNLSGQTVRCPIGTMNAGQTAPLSVVFNTPSTIACDTNVTGSATVSTTTTDPNPANNSASSNQTTITCAQCQDGIDNDLDNRTDSADPACHTDGNANNQHSYNPTTNSETKPQCSDTKDNDNDGLIDENDPNCHVGNDISKPYVPAHTSESGGAPFDPGGFNVTE